MDLEGEDTVSKLVRQCSNNDVDVKIDALAKLQTEMEAGTEIHDTDGLINALKTCLRTSNLHLSAAALAALPISISRLCSRPGSSNLSRSMRVASPTSSTSSSGPSSFVDTVTLRQVLVALLPTGGLIERLGDKERIQLKARESLVVLGGFAFRSSGGTSTMSSGSKSGKGPETPLAMFERSMRESGLGSKVWKVREQSLLTLVHLRREHHAFPVRPYLPLLVESLEDMDAHVRDCARQSVVELFSGPAVTDAARADLKKEMTKKGVRKTIVDGVLSKVLAGGKGESSTPPSREGSENGDIAMVSTTSKKNYIPPSLALKTQKPSATSSIPRSFSQSSAKEPYRPASRAATSVPTTPAATEASGDVETVYIASSRDMETEFNDMQQHFSGKETEHNWAPRDKSITRVRGMLKGNAHVRYADTFYACLKDFLQASLKTLASLRTTVAVNTCLLYSEMVEALGTNFDPYCDILLSSLLKMAGFVKKITAQQSQACVSSLIKHTSGNPRLFIPLFSTTMQEKTVQARVYTVNHLKYYLEIHGFTYKQQSEASGGADTLDKMVRKGLSDVNPGVKEAARASFWIFNEVWPDRGAAILASLDTLPRKQLEKTCPDPSAIQSLPPSTPQPQKKGSVAAAIAASRAKAKAIATAPPSLRHQATSSSHTNVMRSGSPSPPSRPNRVSMARPSSPLRASTSPPSNPRLPSTTRSPPSTHSRMSPGRQPRSVTNESVLTHARAMSSGSEDGVPPSPTPKPLFAPARSTSTATAATPAYRRASSPLSPGSVRRASQIPLPSSPGSDSSKSTGLPVTRTVLRRPGSISHAAPAVPAALTGLPFPRDSLLFPQGHDEDSSLLLATQIPVPEDDSDDEGDHTMMNLMSFSSIVMGGQQMTPQFPRRTSQAQSMSPKTDDSPGLHLMSNTLSSDSFATTPGKPVVEDALRATAEQAESAAERLLELNDGEEHGHSPIPQALLIGSKGIGDTNGSETTRRAKPPPLPFTNGNGLPPSTPVNRSTAVLRQAALFKDSPAHSGSPASLLDVLRDKRHESGWWLKRKNLLAHMTASSPPGTQEVDLSSYIAALETETDAVDTLQKLTLFCIANPSIDAASSSGIASPTSPSPFITPSSSDSSMNTELWEKNRRFDKMFEALLRHLDPSKDEEELEYGLILVWELLENQAPHMEGKEGELFSALLMVRYCNKGNILEATNTIRDALASTVDPVYGLTTLHGCLRTFQADEPPVFANAESKSASVAFGLMALGKFILRLPAEIAEEELPRLKTTLITGLNDRSSLVIRESAAAAIIAAQVVFRNETRLFALLEDLADDKKNLLTYLFDKHGVRRPSSTPAGMDKLEKEMRRLDVRTSTPPRRP